MSTEKMQSKYKLVVFVQNKGRLKTIEIIPSAWIYHDNLLDKLFAYYPENKLNNKDTWRKIEESIKQCKPPQKSWPVYEVDIRGTADCYEEAEQKLSNLTRQSYVFSTDCEISAKEKSLREKNKYKFLTIKNNPKKTKDLFDSARINLKKQNKPSDKSFSNNETDSISHNISERISKVNSIYSTDSTDSSFSKTKSKLKKRNVAKIKRKNLEDSKIKKFKRIRTLSGSSSDTTSLDSAMPHSLKSYNKDANLLDDHTLADNEKQESTESFSLKNYTGEESIETFNISFDGNGPDKEDNKMDNDGTVMELIKGCYEYCRSIDRKIDRIKGQLIEIKNEIKQSKAMTNQKEYLVDPNFGHDEEADGFKLPCSTIATLNTFDTKLKEDTAYRRKIKVFAQPLHSNLRELNRKVSMDSPPVQFFNDSINSCFSLSAKICVMIKSLISKERSIPRNLGETIRKFITKDVANQMTPLKRVPGKAVFAELKLYDCLYAIYSLIFKNNKQPLSKKTFETAIKGVINNSMDWSGGRSKRNKLTKSD